MVLIIVFQGPRSQADITIVCTEQEGSVKCAVNLITTCDRYSLYNSICYIGAVSNIVSQSFFNQKIIFLVLNKSMGKYTIYGNIKFLFRNVENVV